MSSDVWSGVRSANDPDKQPAIFDFMNVNFDSDGLSLFTEDGLTAELQTGGIKRKDMGLNLLIADPSIAGVPQRKDAAEGEYYDDQYCKSELMPFPE